MGIKFSESSSMKSSFLSFVSWSILCLSISFQCVAADDANQTFFERLGEDAGADHRGIVAKMNGENTSSVKDINLTDSLYDDLWTIPDTVISDGGRILTQKENFTALMLAIGGSIALRQSGADERIANSFDDHPAFRDKWSDEGLAIVGGPGFHFAAAGLWYGVAHGSGDEFNKARSWKLIEALSITGATIYSLKLIVRDDCPNGKKGDGWPSGHTASSFTVAAVMDEYYGPAVGIPAYLGAGVVGYRMMDSGDHWASDVLFGMVLGHIVGHQVAGQHKKFELAGFELVPYLDSYQQANLGVSLVKNF
jgi:membrane-associated phospholipid phosphatase